MFKTLIRDMEDIKRKDGNQTPGGENFRHLQVSEVK